MVEPFDLMAKLVRRIQTFLTVPVKRRIPQINIVSAGHKSITPVQAPSACQLVREEGAGSTSGAFGLTSPDGVISSASDLRLAAFSTSTAANSGFPVARAKLKSAIA
jgi:hypothetical protein